MQGGPAAPFLQSPINFVGGSCKPGGGRLRLDKPRSPSPPRACWCWPGSSGSRRGVGGARSARRLRGPRPFGSSTTRRAAMRYRIHSALITTAAMLLGSGPALAVGGDDVNTGDQGQCRHAGLPGQDRDLRGQLREQAAAAMNACLDAIVKCDEQATEAKALTCRLALLVPNTGACAHRARWTRARACSATGPRSTPIRCPALRAVLLRQMRTYSNTLQKKCFTRVVDLGSIATGLGFSPTPGTSSPWPTPRTRTRAASSAWPTVWC